MTTAHVLWTGGWDSTFRVLTLALVENRPVQPHYLLDPGRESSDFELAAMEAIRAEAHDRGARIEAPFVQSVQDVPVSREAAEKQEALAAGYGIGPQYLWLAEYAKQAGVECLELCIHVDDRAYSPMSVWQDLCEREEAEPIDAPESLFRFFSFPLPRTSKLEMLKEARRYGLENLMELTWFCHRPTRSGRPCGFCNPCRWTAEEGLARRLGPGAKLRRNIATRLVHRLPGFRVRRTAYQLLRWSG